MRTDFAIEKLCNIAPIIDTLSERLSKDTEFKTLMQGEKTNRAFLFKVFPYILKNYREETFEILAVWSDRTVEEVEAQAFGETVKQIKELVSDEDFRSFFSSSSDSVGMSAE